MIDEEVEAVDAARDARAEDGFGFGGVGSAPDGGVELADVLVERADAVRVGAGHLGDIHPERFAVHAHARASGDGVVRLERARHPDGVVVQGRRVPTQLGERVDRAVLDHGERGDECRTGNRSARGDIQAISAPQAEKNYESIACTRLDDPTNRRFREKGAPPFAVESAPELTPSRAAR